MTNDTPKSVEAKVMHITPRMAAAWLATNTTNRPISKGNLNNLIKEIKSGHWEVNGEAIKFDTESKLIDGQHRLTAVVRTNIAIHSLVVFDVNETAFDTLDQGKMRGISDVLAIHGKSMVGRLAAGIRCAVMLNNGSMALNDKVSNKEAMEFFAANPGIAEFVNVSLVLKTLTSAYVYCGLRYLLHVKHPTESAVFFELLETGVGLTERSPIKALRDKLMVQSKRDAKMRPIDTLAMTIKAWNLYISGRTITKLTWGANETFPTIK